MFDLDGEARMIALIWPRGLEEINMNVSANFGKLTLVSDLIDFVQSNISVSSDERILRSSFQLSSTEAKDLAALVRKYQQHICDQGVNCESCRVVELPSLETIVTESSTQLNVTNSNKLIKLWKEHLLNLSAFERQNLSTFDWLEELTGGMTGEIDEARTQMKLEFNEKDYLFDVDDRLVKLLNDYAESPMTGVFHYVLSCSTGSYEGGIILRKLKILDCFTKPFNPLLLKAAESGIRVHIGNNLNLAGKLMSRLPKNVSQETLIPDQNIIFTHSEISFAEAISMFDKTKSRTLNSSAVSYVNAKSKRHVCFKKAKEDNINNFRLNHSNDMFTMMHNIISRHFSRLNGRSLILAETVSWYLFVGVEKSKEVFDIFKDSLATIPTSDVECVFDSAENLPDFLICQNGDVLKKCSK